MGKAKVKDNKKDVVRKKHLHARIAYLSRAATYLKTHQSGDPQVSSNESEVETQGQEDSSAQINGHGKTTRDKPCRPPLGLPAHLNSHLRQTALRSQIRLSSQLKRTICKTCNNLLIEGQSMRKTMENSSRRQVARANVLVEECVYCCTTKRFPVGTNRQLKKSERERIAREKVAEETLSNDSLKSTSGTT